MEFNIKKLPQDRFDQFGMEENCENCLASSYRIHEISLRVETVLGRPLPLFVLRQFSGDHCRTVFNISDIIRVHPALSFLLPSTLQIHIYATTTSSLEELMITTEPKKMIPSFYCVAYHIAYRIAPMGTRLLLR
jgi:hypothetical protein